jgi:hypothetical protein
MLSSVYSFQFGRDAMNASILFDIAFILAVLLIIAFSTGFFTKRWNWKQRLGGLAAIIFISLLWGLIFPYIDQPLDSMMEYLASLRFPIAAIVLISGVLAYKFKRYNQRLYGKVEVVFAIIGSFYVIREAKVPFALAQWATLAGFTYVIARGLSNVSEADAKENRKNQLKLLGLTPEGYERTLIDLVTRNDPR